MNKRKAMSKKKRFEVFKRDGFECQYCGATPPNTILHVDHIVPVKEGGENDPDNLVTSCIDCNLGKGATPLTVIPESLADKAARVQESEQQLEGYTAIMREKRERIEDQAWEVADLFIECFADDGIRKDWLASIKRFIERMGVVAVIYAMEIATSRKPFSKNSCFQYFCGICWSKIKQGDSEQ